MSEVVDSDFAATAARAEKLARSSLPRYKALLLMYGLLGYVVIFAMAAGLVVTVCGLAFLAVKSTAALLFLLKKKLIFIIIPVLWVLISSLWVRIEPPKGYTVTRGEFPELFDAIDTVRKTLSAPRVHEVILTPELNAAVTQTPRLGILGWNKNTLVLGIELLLVLSPQQAAAVIAHELGHLSGNHSRFNGWIYRVRQSWFNIMQAFDRAGGMGAGVMRRFFDWYAPRFAAYSFALARANEYEADAMSAQLTNAQVTGEALVNVHVSAPYVAEKYWTEFFRKADEIPEPDHMPWHGLSRWLADNSHAQQELSQRLEDALTQNTDYADTHPCLRDRLDALGVSASIPQTVSETAAAAWLGDNYEKVIGDFDQDWHDEQAPRWCQRYEFVLESREKLRQLSNAEPGKLSDDELWQLANLTEEFGDRDKALPLFRQLQERHPENPATAFAIGRLVYGNQGDEVLEQMKIAGKHPGLTIDACQIAYSFLDKSGRQDEAQWWIDLANERADINRQAAKERAELTVYDTIVPIELSDESIDVLVKQLQATGKAKHAWVAQKQVKHYPESPALAVAVVVSGFALSEELIKTDIEEHVDLACECFIVPKAGDYKKLAKKIVKTGQQIL